MLYKVVIAMSAVALVACDESASPVDAGGGTDASVERDGGPPGRDAGSDGGAPVDAPAETDAGARPSFGSAIGVVGCSNTNQAVQGYLAVSSVDAMINTAQGGQAMREWSVATGGPWDRYEMLRPAGGFSAVWLNLCQRAADGLDQSVVDTVIANIRSRDPAAPIIISPLNFYEAETCRVTNGNEIPNAGAALSDSTAAADPTVFRGPDLGPFGAGMLQMDECHLNDAGIRRAGEQMVAYFDM